MQGDMKKLNQSATYPVGFGYAMAPCLVCTYHVNFGCLSAICTHIAYLGWFLLRCLGPGIASAVLFQTTAAVKTARSTMSFSIQPDVDGDICFRSSWLVLEHVNLDSPEARITTKPGPQALTRTRNHLKMFFRTRHGIWAPDVRVTACHCVSPGSQV